MSLPCSSLSLTPPPFLSSSLPFACQGVGHIHKHRFVHCNLKFENALLKEVAPNKAIVKVTEFSSAHGERIHYTVCAHADMSTLNGNYALPRLLPASKLNENPGEQKTNPRDLGSLGLLAQENKEQFMPC